jgi:hypothetical protein
LLSQRSLIIGINSKHNIFNRHFYKYSDVWCFFAKLLANFKDHLGAKIDPQGIIFDRKKSVPKDNPKVVFNSKMNKVLNDTRKDQLRTMVSPAIITGPRTAAGVKA